MGLSGETPLGKRGLHRARGSAHGLSGGHVLQATALERVKDLTVGAISTKGVELFAALCATVGSTGRATDWAARGADNPAPDPDVHPGRL